MSGTPGPRGALVGRVLGRTYRVERLLGAGGMGEVYLAQHLRTGGLCAIKVLHREAAADLEIYARFQAEARTVSALRHPNIVQVTDFDQDEDGTPFIVMELLDGVDLHTRLEAAGRLALPQVLDLARQVGSALWAAHQRGVVHRDVKPQNVFLCRHDLADGSADLVKVVDFGISKIRRSASQVTRDQMLLGTPHFMSPEAAMGQNANLDGRADQFSLGVILYRALTGRLPFDGEGMIAVLYQVVHQQAPPIDQLASGLPPHVAQAITRALAKDPAARYPTMGEFVRAICGPMSQPLRQVGGAATEDRTHIFSAGGGPSTLSRAAGQTQGILRRDRRWVLAAGMVLGLAVAGLILLSGRGGPGSNRKDAPSAPLDGPRPAGRPPPAATAVNQGPTAAPPAAQTPGVETATPDPGPSAARARPAAPQAPSRGKGSSRHGRGADQRSDGRRIDPKL